MKNAVALGVMLFLETLLPLRAKDAEPRREAGLFVHLIPRQLAEAQASPSLGAGFVVSVPGESRAAATRPAAGSVAELIRFLRGQPGSVQQNGIWLVLAYSKAYSPEEKARVVELKRVCRRERIPLFIARDQELPKGWQRFSRRSPGAGQGRARIPG